MSEDKNIAEEYNKDIAQTPGIFGDHVASAFQVTADNTAGNPPAAEVQPFVNYHQPAEDLSDTLETPTVEGREKEEEERVPAGPAHAAQLGITDPSDGTTQTTASPEDQANAAALEGTSSDLGTGENAEVKDADKTEEENQNDAFAEGEDKDSAAEKKTTTRRTTRKTS